MSCICTTTTKSMNCIMGRLNNRPREAGSSLSPVSTIHCLTDTAMPLQMHGFPFTPGWDWILPMAWCKEWRNTMKCWSGYQKDDVPVWKPTGVGHLGRQRDRAGMAECKKSHIWHFLSLCFMKTANCLYSWPWIKKTCKEICMTLST